ncbi:MAG: right-handed parallel beta-helix repeat-containing protein [Thermoplasmata archaeon]|nr:right-handed parallel beta-helix repeat-containing protein [Thermoplasmata archaeon]
MKRKCLVIGIIFLFVGTFIIPATAQNIETQSLEGNWLYVGGSGPGNYSTIQDAVDASSDGDTVFVYDDSSPYYENIVINKKINLIGEDKYTTIIKRFEQNFVIAIITVDLVTVSGFTITSSKQDNYTGIQICSSFHTISGNIFERNEMGIVMFTSCYSTKIYNNIFQNNTIGIDIKGSSFNDIFNNSFLSNWIGIVVREGIGNTIANNTFIKREVGIHLGGNSNKIIDNVILSQQWGIEISNCSDNEIRSNNFSLNYYGIVIESNADNNTIQDNFLNHNLRNIKILSDCDYNLLEKNTILNSSHYGMQVSGSYNEIQCNLIKDNYNVGIEISGSNNNISYNTIENNIKGVVLLQDSRYNKITFNNFIKNNGFFTYSFLQRRSHNVWDSNYWSSHIGKVKIIIGVTKIVLYYGYEKSFTICLIRLNFDWHPAKEPYDIPGII